MKFLNLFPKSIRSRGFILPLAMLICTIILIISTGITNILVKEVYFSKLSRMSQLAYYAADDGVMCAVMVDDRYFDTDTGYGIFPYNQLIDPSTAIQNTLDKVNTERQVKNLSSLVINDIACATAPIFDTTVSGFTTDIFSRINSLGATENGISSTYSMRMNLGDGNFRCALITVNKTANYRQIISRGYATCLESTIQPIERAVVNTTESL